jgi:hypothetical protein
MKLPLLLCLLAAQAGAQGRPAWVAHRVLTPPIVDGNLSEWEPGLFSIAPVLEPTFFVESGNIEGHSDHHLEAWAVVQGPTLYIAIRVTDDMVAATQTAGEIWRDDGVELLFSTPTGELVHLGVSPKGQAWFYRGRNAVKDLRAAAVMGEPGFTVEVAIPLQWLPKPPFAFNLAARDIDGPSEAHLTWAGLRHHQVATFGTMHVTDAPKRLPSAPPCPLAGAAQTLTQPLRVNGLQLSTSTGTPVVLRLVNYQPAVNSWVRQWTSFDVSQVDADLTQAAQLGANGIRLFVFWDVFGGATPDPVMLQRLDAVIATAASKGLVSVVSFFPFKKEFRRERWPEMESHLRAVLRRHRGNPAIAMWDLMNEPDHMWGLDAGATANDVFTWAEHMARVAREEDPTHLVTVGLAGHFAARGDAGISPIEALPFVDVVSVHGYFDRPLGEVLGRAAQLGKPVILQEYGVSRLYASANEARSFDETTCRIARDAGVSGVAAWELFDHPVGSIHWYPQPWRDGVENYFGMIDHQGRRLPRAVAFCKCLEPTRFRVTPWPKE